MTSKKVLVAPLNWGLGHATRCVPIIRSLIKQKDEVILASDGRALALLKAEFPSLVTESLPSYDISYPINKPLQYWLKKVPQIIRTIGKENIRTNDLVQKYDIRHIFSDNRYGVYHPECRNILMTHQLNLPLPDILSWPANNVLRKLISKFDECWVPDFFGAKSLAGDMSQSRLPIPAFYIGPISRFHEMSVAKTENILAIISGPEPHRSLVEKKILHQLAESGCKYEVVKGRTEEFAEASAEGVHLEAATSEALEEKLGSSAFVICRSGYSSIMDLYRTRRKALLIPTPNQPEQMALAARHRSNLNFLTQKESQLNLSAGIESLKRRKAIWPTMEFADPDKLVRLI